MTRRFMTNVAMAEGNRGPMGQLIKARKYPDASFRDVTAPNADTLYTTAWIDVANEPWVLSIPDMKDRYFLMPMLDGWTNVFQVPGKRTTGTGAQTYAITGPGWNGTLPTGVTEYKSPTNLVWISAASIARVRRRITRLSMPRRISSSWSTGSHGRPYTPPQAVVNPSIDMKTGVREQVNRMDATAYSRCSHSS